MKRVTPQEALKGVEWLNWVGDKDYARRRLIILADQVLGRSESEPKVSSFEQKAKQKGKAIERIEEDEYVIR